MIPHGTPSRPLSLQPIRWMPAALGAPRIAHECLASRHISHAHPRLLFRRSTPPRSTEKIQKTFRDTLWIFMVLCHRRHVVHSRRLKGAQCCDDSNVEAEGAVNFAGLKCEDVKAKHQSFQRSL